MFRTPYRNIEPSRLVLSLLVVLVCVATGGCVGSTVQSVRYASEGQGDVPVVISASPGKDAAAFRQSDQRLSDADWSVLDKLGPRPVWEQLEHKQAARPQTCPATRRASVPTTRRHEEAEDHAQVFPTPDGKLKLIWVLRHVGGSTVASSREPTTARRTVALTAPDLAPYVAVLQQLVGAAGTVMPVPRENTLVITCDQAMKGPVLEMLSRLDVPAAEVEIAARVFEVSRDFDFQQGARLILSHVASDGTQNLASTFDTRRFLDALSSGGNPPFQGSVLHLIQAFHAAGVSVDASFQLLADSGLIQVVSAPRMTVSVGQTGYMLAGQEIPVQSSNLVNNVIQVATLYKPVGVQLYITPESAGPARVKMHTISIVSSISGFAPLPSMNGGSTPPLNPIIDSREAETAVTVDDGSTLVISGLRLTRVTTRENKIPGLGDLPGVGWLFKNHRSQQEQTDLYFFVTPRLLETASAD